MIFNRSRSDLSRYKSGHQGAPRSKAELEEVHRSDGKPDRRRKRRADRVAKATLRAIPALSGAGSGPRWVSRSWGFTWVVLACAAVAGRKRSGEEKEETGEREGFGREKRERREKP